MTSQERLEKLKKFKDLESDLAFWATQFVNCKKLGFKDSEERAFKKIVELVETRNNVFESCFDK